MSVGNVRDEAREAKFRKEVDKVFTAWHAPVFTCNIEIIYHVLLMR